MRPVLGRAGAAARRRRVALFSLIAGVGALCFHVTRTEARLLASGPASCNGVALTFDLCPVRDPPGFDAGLTALLEETRTPATFFMSGRWLLRHESEARSLARVPFFELGTHGFAHAHLPTLDEPGQREEIGRAVTLLRDRLGVTARVFRPPYGEYDEWTERVIEALGLRGVTWSVVSGDPDPALTAKEILDRIARRLRPGSLVIFHANGKGHQTRAVVQTLVERVLPGKGLRPMTVDELLECRTPPQ